MKKKLQLSTERHQNIVVDQFDTPPTKSNGPNKHIKLLRNPFQSKLKIKIHNYG